MYSIILILAKVRQRLFPDNVIHILNNIVSL